MFEYIEPYITADAILLLFKKYDRLTNSEAVGIMNELEEGMRDSILFDNAMTKLLEDGYLLKTGSLNNRFKLGGNALIFLNAGGYWSELRRNKEEADIKKLINDSILTTNSNTRETGNSVQILNKTLKPTTIIQAIISVLMLLVAIGTLAVVYLTYESNKDINDIRQRIILLQDRLKQIESQKQILPTNKATSSALLKDSTKK